MIVTDPGLLIFLLVFFLLTTLTSRVDAIAGRCYLCSQNTLAECAGSTQVDSPLYQTVLQYYTEPCNGQCVLFRNDNTSTIRGCSWTYGHMTSKSTGWHELSPGIRAYFCDSYLCNNGTYDQPQKAMTAGGSSNNEFLISSQQTLSPQELFILAGNTLPVIHKDQHLPPNNLVSRQLRQCYSCTARQNGCDEYLDPRYVSRYIRPCTASCIIFRNPNDHNLITRDCSMSWPQVHAKNGLHKLLGSDAFFCQESLCNGISFDFIMGIFHNQLPAVITFPALHTINDSTTTITTISSTTITDALPISTTINTNDDDDDDVIWEDPDLDFVIVEPTTTTVAAVPTLSTSLPLPTEFPDDSDSEDESSTIPLQPIEHFDLLDEISASSTIAGGAAVAEQDSQFHWWDLNEASLPPITELNLFPRTTTTTLPPNTFTIIPSTMKLTPVDNDDSDDWAIFNTSSIPLINHLDVNADADFDMNDYFTLPTLSTNDLINKDVSPIVPFYFTNSKTEEEEMSGLIKPAPTLAMPPFSWMLHLANQNRSGIHSRQASINPTLPTTSLTIINKKKSKKKSMTLKGKTTSHFDHFYELCKKKQCQNGGRLNADCLCICLPAFSGDHCEIGHCEQEPAHICDFVLDHECKSDYVRYLCPKFCRMNICSSTKSS